MIQTGPDQRRQFLCFALAGVDCAVGIMAVREILQLDTLTRVPSAPAHVRGVLNLRGAVVPVVDLAVKLGLAETPVTRRTCVIIVEAALGDERAVVGIVADEVSEVLELGPADVEPAPSFGTDVRVEHLLGMGKVGDGFVLLLDLDQVLSAREHELAQPAAGDAPPEAAPEPPVEDRAADGEGVPPEAAERGADADAAPAEAPPPEALALEPLAPADRAPGGDDPAP